MGFAQSSPQRATAGAVALPGRSQRAQRAQRKTEIGGRRRQTRRRPSGYGGQAAQPSPQRATAGAVSLPGRSQRAQRKTEIGGRRRQTRRRPSGLGRRQRLWPTRWRTSRRAGSRTLFGARMFGGGIGWNPRRPHDILQLPHERRRGRARTPRQVGRRVRFGKRGDL